MGVRYSPSIVTDNLRFLIDAANLKSYPGSTTSWRDLDESNNITISTSATSSFDGFSLTFNGTNQFGQGNTNVAATSNLVNNSGSAMTVAAWINPDARSVIASKTDDNTNQGWLFGVNSLFQLGFETIRAPTNARVFSTAAISQSQWQYVAATFNFNSQQVLFYSNGNILGSTGQQSATGSVSSDLANRLYIGFTSYLPVGSSVVGGNYCSGSLSSVAIYDRVLSSTEILQNFNATRGRFGV